MRRLPVLLAALALAACDAAEPSIVATGSFGPIEATRRTPPVVLDVADAFEATGLDGPLQYTSFSTSARVARATFDGSEMTVTFGVAGRAVIQVAATDGRLQATVPLSVAVAMGPGFGQADFLPMAAGTLWDYDYAFETTCPGTRIARDGRVSVAFLDQPEGYDGEREIAAEVRVAYTQTTDVGGTPQTETVEKTTPVTFSETDEGVALGVAPLQDLGLEVPARLERYRPDDLSVVIVDTGFRRLTLRPAEAPTVSTTSTDCVAQAAVSLTPRG